MNALTAPRAPHVVRHDRPTGLAPRVRLAWSQFIAALASAQRPAPMVRAVLQTYVRYHGIDLEDFYVPLGFFRSFRELHGRAIRPGARRISADSLAVFPSDGFVLATGEVHAGRVMQVKGMEYDLASLLGPGGGEKAARFDGGRFINLYLPVHSYHRWCSPIDGRLVTQTHICGDRLSLGLRSLAWRRDVYVTNERLVQDMEGADFALTLVAVGGIAASHITSRHALDTAAAVPCRKGDELGAFWLGSTIVILLPRAAQPVTLQPHQRVLLGESLVPPHKTTESGQKR